LAIALLRHPPNNRHRAGLHDNSSSSKSRWRKSTLLTPKIGVSQMDKAEFEARLLAGFEAERRRHIEIERAGLAAQFLAVKSRRPCWFRLSAITSTARTGWPAKCGRPERQRKLSR